MTTEERAELRKSIIKGLERNIAEFLVHRDKYIQGLWQDAWSNRFFDGPEVDEDCREALRRLEEWLAGEGERWAGEATR